MTAKVTIQITIPVEAAIADLLPEHEFRFVSEGMANPANIDESIPMSDHRQWFRDMWHAQVRLQRLLLANPDYLTRFLAHLAISEIETNPVIEPESLESALDQAIRDLGEEGHFFPVFEETTAGTAEMTQAMIDAVTLSFGKPTVTVVPPDTTAG